MKENAIYCGDAERVLRQFDEKSMDLIYLDPPFFSQKNYEVIWGDGYERRAFDDRWKGGVQNYIAWMEPKLRECHRVLKDAGTLWTHCDWHANAHLRVLLDRIFGREDCFRNEVVWCYSGGGVPKKDFPRKHDTIFRYTKGKDWTFNVEYRPYAKGIIPTHSDGSALDLERGTPITDWWTDLKAVTPFSAKRDEKIGYPTQKPEALMERIVRTTSNEGDLVLDPFCGCGTTIAAALKLKRRWIGVDISPTACRLMADRMRKLGVPISVADVIGMPKTLEELKAMQPFEFQNWACGKLGARVNEKKVGDMGIDGWLMGTVGIQVKQSEHVGRNVVDNFETALKRQKKTRGVILAFSFGRGAHEEAARAKNEEALEIELLTVADLVERG